LIYLNSSCNGLVLGDDIYYREWALRIRDGDWLGQGTFEQGPLYAYVLALGFLAGIPEPVLLFLQMMSGVAVCALVYLCGRELFDERIATAAGVVTALYGPFLFYECMFMKTFLSPLFVTLTLYFGLRYARTSNWWWVGLSGATIGLACLLRESYVLLLLPLALWVWSRAGAGPGGWRTRLGHWLAVAAGFGLILTPSAVRNYLVAGEWVLVTTGGGEVIYIAHGPEADGYWHSRPVGSVKVNPRQEHQAYRDEAERRTGRKLTAAQSSRYWYGEALRAILADPGRFGSLTAKRAANLLNDLDFPDSSDYQTWRQFIPLLYLLPSFGWIVAFGMLGIAICVLDWKRHGLAIGLIAMIVLSVLLTYTFGRFRLGMMPLWILYATAGFFAWLSWWRSNSGRKRILAATATVACLAMTIFAFLPPPGAEVAYSPEAQDFWRNVVSTHAKARKSAAELQAIANPNAEIHSHLGRQLI
jgi:4-amino-4-deoxy-L-arabinose transferase-like glycosyltransferase